MVIRKTLKLNKHGSIGANITEQLKELGFDSDSDVCLSIGVVGKSIHINPVVII